MEPAHNNPQPETLAAALGAFLGSTVERLRVLASGWETTLYEFALRSRSEMMPAVAAGAPLVLRFYPSAKAAAKGAREFAILNYLAEAGFPAPRACLFEPDPTPIGAPFLVMERVRGGPLFAVRSFPQAFRTFSMGFLGFVRAQVRLHRMTPPPDLNQLPAPSTSDCAAAHLLDHTLATIAQRIEEGPLPGLAEALGRLRARAGEFRAAPASFLHLDYHPQNVLVEGLRVTGVIDWANAAAGDRHFDAATTAVILSTSAMEHPRWMRQNIVGNTLRRNFYLLYVALYHTLAPLDLRRLRYYQGLAATLRLSMLGMMRTRTPESVGFRADAISEVTPSVLGLLSRYTARKTGARVTVP
jgi:aminoglycoside phosphotransferase (APT) family kinase protein